MLAEAEIKEQVLKAAISFLKNQDRALLGTERFDELGFDLLDMFEFILKIEDAFVIEITDEEAATCISVPTVISCVQKKLGK